MFKGIHLQIWFKENIYRLGSRRTFTDRIIGFKGFNYRFGATFTDWVQGVHLQIKYSDSTSTLKIQHLQNEWSTFTDWVQRVHLQIVLEITLTDRIQGVNLQIGFKEYIY